MVAGAPDTRASAADMIVLGAIVLLSLLLYVSALGLYSDDWVFLGILHRSPDQSLPGLMQALHQGDFALRQRPIQILYLAMGYKLFGFEPLGYHLVNASALLIAVLALYAVLRELALPRALALAVPAVYATMPNFATDRFWMAAHQATLSITLVVAGAYCALRGLRAIGLRSFVALEAAAACCFVLSGLAYEVALPLLAPLAVILAVRARRLGLAGPRQAVAVAAALLPLVAVVLFKAAATNRVGVDQAYPEYLASLAGGAARVNLGAYGIGLPYVLWWIARHALDPAALAAGAGVGALAGASVWRAWSSEARSRAPRLLAAGALVFVLGYAVFVVPTAGISFSSASLANRLAIAAALGVAAAVAGLLAWALPRRAFAVAVGAFCGAACIVTNTLARFWESAYREQQRIVAGMTSALPDLPAGATVVIDGVCLERGGAYVFTGKRDVTGVLQVRYTAPGVRGSAITNPPRIGEQGIMVFTLREPDLLRYRPALIVYDASRRRAYRLRSRRQALAYFRGSNFSPRRDCLPGFAWRGPAPRTD